MGLISGRNIRTLPMKRRTPYFRRMELENLEISHLLEKDYCEILSPRLRAAWVIVVRDGAISVNSDFVYQAKCPISWPRGMCLSHIGVFPPTGNLASAILVQYKCVYDSSDPHSYFQTTSEQSINHLPSPLLGNAQLT